MQLPNLAQALLLSFVGTVLFPTNAGAQLLAPHKPDQNWARTLPELLRHVTLEPGMTSPNLNAPCSGRCNPDCNGSCPMANGELLIGSQAYAQALSDADRIVEQAQSQSQSCDGCGSSGNAPPILTAGEQFRQRLAKHVMTCITSPEIASEKKEAAIRAALDMAVERVVEEADKELLQTELKNRVAVQSLQYQFKQLAAKRINPPQPVGAAVNSTNTRMLESIAQSNAMIVARLQNLESRLTQYDVEQMARKEFLDGLKVDEKSLRLAREREIEKLYGEIELLDARIKRLQTPQIRQASFLEPIEAEKRLVPVQA